MRASHRGFTLIELLVVIAIVAVLAVTVILTLNPAELLKQARDSTRLSDFAMLTKALAAYQSEGTAVMGTSSVVYVSLPDSSATCANLGLQGLPVGWSYSCRTAANLRNTNGTGWLPVNLAGFSAGSPLSALPIDPVNTSSSLLYYTYAPDANGKYVITTSVESNKLRQSSALRDGGTDPARYETGTDVLIAAQHQGVVAYWSFDDAQGATVPDLSGTGNAATLINGPTLVAGKLGNALSLDGVNDYADTASSTSLSLGEGGFSVWMQANVSQIGNARIVGVGTVPGHVNAYIISGTAQTRGVAPTVVQTTPTPINDVTWHHLAWTWGAGGARLYLDGVRVQNVGGNQTQTIPSPVLARIGAYVGSNYFYSGLLDEIRLYNRMLTDAEVAAQYQATR